MRKTRSYWNAVPFFLLLLGCGEHPTSPPVTSESTWSLLATGESFVDVWGSSSTEAFALGSRGTLLHYNGSNWSTFLPAPRSVSGSVWGTSPRDFFIAGSGAIHHYDGYSWNVVYSGLSEQLEDIWGTTRQDVFVVGWDPGTQKSLILHYDGDIWTRMPVETASYLNAVWGASSQDVFAVGTDGTVLHYNGTLWAQIPTGTTTSLSAIWGSSGSDVYAVARSEGLGSQVLHYNGLTWDIAANSYWPLLAIWGSSSTDVYVVGQRGTILHYNGTSWNEARGGGDLYAVWGAESQDVFAVGGGDDFNSQTGSMILHYDGLHWTAESVSMLKGSWFDGITGIGGTSTNNVYFVGGHLHGATRAAHYDGSRFTDRIFDNNEGAWMDVSVTMQDVVFLVQHRSGSAWGIVSRYDGMHSTQWTLPGSFLSVWADSVEAFVVGTEGNVSHFDGVSWSSMSSGTTCSLLDVWGSSPTDVFAVGESGTVCHYDGSNWTAIPTQASADLLAVGGSSADNIYAVGDAGAILHYGGLKWDQIGGLTQEDLSGIWSGSEEDVFIVGREVVLHYNGQRWNTMSDSINGAKVWGSENDVYLVDEAARIFKLQR